MVIQRLAAKDRLIQAVANGELARGSQSAHGTLLSDQLCSKSVRIESHCVHCCAHHWALVAEPSPKNSCEAGRGSHSPVGSSHAMMGSSPGAAMMILVAEQSSPKQPLQGLVATKVSLRRRPFGKVGLRSFARFRATEAQGWIATRVAPRCHKSVHVRIRKDVWQDSE